MTQQEKKELRMLVRTMYDYQDMRTRTANRLRMKSDQTPMDDGCMDEMVISDRHYEAIEQTRAIVQDLEKKIEGEIAKAVKIHPLFKEFTLNVLGCGPTMTGVILSEFDIYKADTVSKLWQYAGLNPGEVRGKRIIKSENLKASHEIIKEYKNLKGEKCMIVLTDELIRGDKLTAGFVSPYNIWLRTKLIGVLAGSMIKQKGRESNGRRNYAVEFYYPYKNRLENSSREVKHGKFMVPWKDVSNGHRDAAAKRYMIKMFLQDLYVAWRNIAGLPTRVPYAEEYLGKVHSA